MPEKTSSPATTTSRRQAIGVMGTAAAAGMIDYPRAMMELLTSIRRAGADAILTYHAIEAAEILGG